jgi:alpha-mannosidase
MAVRSPVKFPFTRRAFLAACAVVPARPQPGGMPEAVYLVPNFHPASCGWLTNFSKERVYCANSYLDHLDRVRDDPEYAFVLSECNNMIAIRNFQPARFEELKQRVKEGRVELVNAFFLEPTINLSGGEALVRSGIEGLRWQQQVMGVRPRFAWTIDVCGTHDQMAQICAGLGLEAMVYTRRNRTGSTIHWSESPDGSRVLSLSPGHYSELGFLFSAKQRLGPEQIEQIRRHIRQKMAVTPPGAPVLILGGSGDYALAPALKEYPSEFLRQWKEAEPGVRFRFTTAGRYLDAILPGVRSGAIRIPTMRGGTEYDFLSFWIENPRVKTWYRRSEHQLQAAEMLATIASLSGDYVYPVAPLYHAWLLMLLNMDRNTLWGSAGGMVFEDSASWDVRDRFEWVEATSRRTLEAALQAVAPGKEDWALFNPLNWKRTDPVVLPLPAGKSPAGMAAQLAPDGAGVLCSPAAPPAGIRGIPLGTRAPAQARRAPLPETIETRHYSARIDPRTGALASLRLKPSKREFLSGPANVLYAEKPKEQRGDPGDHMLPRPGRVQLASSTQFPAEITFSAGPVASLVEARGTFFGGGACRRIICFYRDYPRIDFETYLENIPDRTVVVAEFPLAADVEEVRRGIPYGFSHGAWAKPNPDLPGWTKGIVPAVRWSHYALAGGGGVALLDRGLSGRELNGNTPILYLLNATDKYYGYPNAWLSGKGPHRLAYALIAHEEAWAQARIPRMAWEYNCPPVLLPGRIRSAARSWLETSDNVIVEALRREGPEIELRFAECLGLPGTARIRLALPHGEAALTDLTGGNRKPLDRGPDYSFPVRPQQIVTMRFRTDAAVAAIEPLLAWDELVPEAKRRALNTYSNDKGHPPRGN